MQDSQLLAEWHKKRDAFALLSADNRLRVWQTASGALKQQYVDNEDLSAVYTCLAWGSKQKTTKKRSKHGASAAGKVAIGMEKGSVVVWDLATAEICTRIEGHSQRVNAVAFSADAATLYTASSDKHVAEWNVQSGEQISRWKAAKHAVHAVALSPDGCKLATAASTITLWDLTSKASVAKFTGHASPVLPSCFMFSPDGKALFSGAEEDRFINMWAVEEAKAGGGNTGAARVLTVDTAPVAFDVAQAEGANEYSVVCTLVSATAAVWVGLDLNPSKKRVPKPRAASATVRVEGGAPVLRAAWAASAEGVVKSDTDVAVAHGSVAKPTFTVAELYTEDGDVVTDVVLKGSGPTSLLMNGAQSGAGAAGKGKGGAPPVTVVGAADQPMARPAVVDGQRPAKRRKGDKKGDTAADVEGSGLALAGMTIGERVAAEQARTAVPKADSLGNVLLQALQSNDSALLEYCLGVSDARVIRRTVARLPSALVVPFLVVLIERLRAKPGRGVVLVTWIRTVLLQHTSYLLTLPDLPEILSPLFQTVEERLSVFKRLVKLSGRLDLVMTQIKNRQDAHVEIGPPKTVYNEADDVSDDDEEDDEDEDGDEEDEDDEDMEVGEGDDDDDDDGDDESED